MADGIGVAVQHGLRFFREGLRSLFEDAPDTSVVGTAVTPADLVDLCHRTVPDVAVVGLDDHPAALLRSCATLARCFPALRFVGVHPPGFDPGPAHEAGLRTLVSRSEGFDGIRRAVHGSLRAVQGPIDACSRIDRRQIDLTAREVDVLSLVGAGHTSQEISERLAISRKTVENHKVRIFTKLDVQNQAHAVAVAVHHGLIAPDDMLDLGAEVEG